MSLFDPQLDKAKERLEDVCNYKRTPFQMPKYCVRISLTILAVGFTGIGLMVMPSNASPSCFASFLVGGTFGLIAVLL